MGEVKRSKPFTVAFFGRLGNLQPRGGSRVVIPHHHGALLDVLENSRPPGCMRGMALPVCAQVIGVTGLDWAAVFVQARGYVAYGRSHHGTGSNYSDLAFSEDALAAPPSTLVESQASDSEAEASELASLCARDLGEDKCQVSPACADWMSRSASLRPRLICGREIIERCALLTALPEQAFPKCSICFAAK
eukprot:2645502-Amphidinium_carterae.3